MRHQRAHRRARPMLIVIATAAILVVAATIVAVGRHHRPAAPVALPPGTLPHTPETYLGVYAKPVPASYAGVTSFAKVTGVTPEIAVSGGPMPLGGNFTVWSATPG